MGINLQQPHLTQPAKLSDGRIKTPWFRGSFMNVWDYEKPVNPNEAPWQHSITMLFDPTKVDINLLKQEATRVAKERFGSKFEQYAGSPNWHNPFRDGSEKPEYDGYEGMVFVRATSKFYIGVVDENNNYIEKPGPNENDPVYSGAYYQATIKATAFDVNGKRGVKFYLATMKKVADGEPFGGSRPDAAADFGGPTTTTVDPDSVF